MKRILFVSVSAFCLCFAGQATSEDHIASTFLFGGVNYEGNLGLFGGVGQEIGRVDIIPYARWSLDSTLSHGGFRLKKTFGAETIIWLQRTEQFKFGVLASVFNLDWIENQEEPIGTYISQAGGAAVYWQPHSRFAIILYGKMKTQLLAKDTLYPNNFNIALAIKFSNLRP